MYPIGGFIKPVPVSTGCEQCGSDHYKHSLHVLEQKQQTGARLAAAVALALRSLVPVHSHKLTDPIEPALAAWLNFDAIQKVQEINAAYAAASSFDESDLYSADDLVRASGRLDKLERERESYMTVVNKMPEEIRPMMEAGMMLITTMLDNQIEQAKERISAIQEYLETRDQLAASRTTGTGDEEARD